MPRQSSFKKGQRGVSQSPDDMKVAMVPGGGPTVAPNEVSGRTDPGFGKKKRPQFTQAYWRQSSPHQDYLHGNPDARREVVETN